MKNKIMFPIVFSGIWILIGLIFFILGLVMKKNIKKKIESCTSKTYGKVIDIAKRPNNDNSGYNYFPVLEYTVGDMKFIKEYTIGGSSPVFGIGQNLEIYFNPDDYNEYYIGGDKTPTTFAIISIFAGIKSIFIGVASAVIMMLF